MVAIACADELHVTADFGGDRIHVDGKISKSRENQGNRTKITADRDKRGQETRWYK